MTVVSSKRPGIAGAVLAAILAIGLGTPTLAADPACPGGKVKFYRDPMGGPDTSPVPRKDSMNMDYIAVCAGEAEDGPGTVRISLDKVQRLGVRSEEVRERALVRSVRAFASVQFDERKQGDLSQVGKASQRSYGFLNAQGKPRAGPIQHSLMILAKPITYIVSAMSAPLGHEVANSIGRDRAAALRDTEAQCPSSPRSIDDRLAARKQSA